MAALDHNLISGLLLSVLVFVLAMTVFLVWLILRFRHQQTNRAPMTAVVESNPWRQRSGSRRHVAFKRPDCWLAIKSRDLPSVQAALALHDVKPCSWSEGLTGDAEQKLFISPPLSGWVLVIGSALPNPSDDEDACFRFLTGLSRKLGHVQFFSVSGMLNQHAWVRVESGSVLRAYAWAGRTLWNQGPATAAENELEMKCYNYGESPENNTFSYAESGPGNVEKVPLLAARWSLNPDEIDEQFIEREWGIVGEPSRNF